MRRRPLAAMLVLLSAALVLGGNALLDASDDRSNVRELQLIFFGRESDGEGWVEIEARGGSGVRYHACDAAEAPVAARRTLDRWARR